MRMPGDLAACRARRNIDRPRTGSGERKGLSIEFGPQGPGDLLKCIGLLDVFSHAELLG